METPDNTSSEEQVGLTPAPSLAPPPASLELDIKSVEFKGEKTVWAEFQPGIAFHLRYTSRSALQALVRKSSILRFNPTTSRREPTPDEPVFYAAFAKACVLDWRGLTPRTLATIVSVDASKIPKEHLDVPIKFSYDQLVYLLRQNTELDQFVNSVCTSLANFETDFEGEEAKN